MKWVFPVLLLVTLSTHSQIDTINIQFREDQDSFPDCIDYFSSNGSYLLHKAKPESIEMDGFLYVEPKLLMQNKWMTIYSVPQLVNQLPVFHKDRFTYKEISTRTFDSLYSAALKERSVLPLKDFKREFGISVSIEHVENDESSIIQTPNEDSRIDVIADVVVERPKTHIIGGVQINRSDGKIINIVDGVYLKDKRTYLQRVDYLEEYPRIRDSLLQDYDSIRKNLLQPKLDSLLQPFYLSRTEVTNGEYKQFVRYVRDSLALYQAYRDAETDVAFTLLNCAKAARKKLDPMKKEENLKKYGLKMPKGFWEEPIYIPLTTWIYYPQPERFYKHREIDPRKINYRLNDSTVLNIYPDTTVLYKIETAFMDPLSTMYFWHPAYDLYPIVGLNYKQIKAYCHWKEQRVNEEMKLDSFHIQVGIPTLTQYEFALKATKPELVNEAVNTSNVDLLPYYRTGLFEPQQFLQKVNSTLESVNTTNNPLFMNWFRTNYNSVIYFLNGNVSEVIDDKIDENFIRNNGVSPVSDPQNYSCAIGDNYYMGVKTKDDYQFNALFYKRLIPRAKADGLTGFRLLYTVIPAK